MARIYRQDIPTTWAEEHSLSAHLTVHAQRAAEAIYEETRNDLCVLFDKTRVNSEMMEFPIRLRRDRNGLYRSFRVTPLAYTPYGSSGDLYLFIRDTAGRAFWDYPKAEWLGVSVAAHTWLDAETVTIPRDFMPSPYVTHDGDERQITQVAWGFFYWDNISGTPSLGGYRLEELVEDSWL
jgi:hypothetical protein